MSRRLLATDKCTDCRQPRAHPIHQRGASFGCYFQGMPVAHYRWSSRARAWLLVGRRFYHDDPPRVHP